MAKDCSTDEVKELESLLGGKKKKDLLLYARSSDIAVRHGDTKAVIVECLLTHCGKVSGPDRIAALLSCSKQCTNADLHELECLLVAKSKGELSRYARRFNVKVRQGNSKAVILGRLLAYCKLGLTGDGDSEDEQLAEILLTDDDRALLASLPSISSITDGWAKDCSSLSVFSFLHIYSYLIESRDDTFDEASKEAYKSLKGYRYFADQLVRNVWCQLLNCEVLYVKAHVHASWTVESSYNVYVQIIAASGTVADGSCSCVAGKGGTCSHVAGLLFYLASLVEQKLAVIPEDVTSTGLPCTWSKAPKRDVTPAVVADISFTKPEFSKKERTPSRSLTDFDPRQPEDREVNIDAKEKFLRTLQSVYPESGALYFHDCVPLRPGMVEYDLEVATQMVIFDGQAIAPPSAESLDGLPLSDPIVEETVLSTLPEFVCTEEEAACVERATRAQSGCELWHQLHNGRVTSSHFGKLLNRKPSTEPDNLVKLLMGYSKLSVVSPAITWGKNHESTARKAYVAAQRRCGHIALSVSPSGLNIMPTASFLAASTDGKVHDPSFTPSSGVLEIKCPFSISGVNVTDLSPENIAAQYPTQFCLKRSEHGLSLGCKHPYYAQVQGEMAICNCEWCDFVVWTKASVFVQRVQFDKIYWQSLLSKLKGFFTSALLPEIVLRRVQRGLKLDASDVDVSSLLEVVEIGISDDDQDQADESAMDTNE